MHRWRKRVALALFFLWPQKRVAGRTAEQAKPRRRPTIHDMPIMARILYLMLYRSGNRSGFTDPEIGLAFANSRLSRRSIHSNELASPTDAIKDQGKNKKQYRPTE